MRLWGLTNELNGISESNLAVYRNTTGAAWVELGSRAIGNDGSAYSYSQGTTNDFSTFLLGATGNTPTAITMQSLAAQSGVGRRLLGATVFLGAALLARAL